MLTESRRHRQDDRKASTDPEKQANFLEDFSPLSRKIWTLEKTESYCEKARPRRKQPRQSWKERQSSRSLGDRFDTDDRRRHLACMHMHACRRAVCFFSKAVETGINLSCLVPLPWKLKMAAGIGVLDVLAVALSL